MKMKSWILGMVVAAALAACNGSPAPGATADERAIASQMHATWDRPDAPLEVGPIVVDNDYAVAGWTQGAMGGRALLRRENGAWTTVLCAGDGIRDAEGLGAVGMPASQATALAAKLADAEKELSAERLALMASFRGIVRMETAVKRATLDALAARINTLPDTLKLHALDPEGLRLGRDQVRPDQLQPAQVVALARLLEQLSQIPAEFEHGGWRSGRPASGPIRVPWTIPSKRDAAAVVRPGDVGLVDLPDRSGG